MCVIPVVCVTIKTIRPLKGHSSVKFNISHKLLRPMDELDFSETLQKKKGYGRNANRHQDRNTTILVGSLETGSQLTYR